MTMCNDIHVHVQYDMINLPGGSTLSAASEYTYAMHMHVCNHLEEHNLYLNAQYTFICFVNPAY